MAVALVAHTLIAGGTAGGTSGSINTTGASLLVVSIAQQGTDVTVSDSKSNSWTGLTVYGTSPKCRIFYATNPNVGTGHTFTINGASSFSAGCAAAFSGVKTTTPFESQNGATASSGTTIQTGSVTAAENGALLVSAISGDTGFNPAVTISSGFTVTDARNYVPSTSYGPALAYLIQATAAAINPTWTNPTSTAFATAIAVFTPAISALAPRQTAVTVN